MTDVVLTIPEKIEVFSSDSMHPVYQVACGMKGICILGLKEERPAVGS